MRLRNTKALLAMIAGMSAMLAWLALAYGITRDMTDNDVAQLAAWIALGILLPSVIATLWFDYLDRQEER